MPDDGLDHVDGRAPYSADSGLAASIFVITSSFSVAVITAPFQPKPQLSAVGRKPLRVL